jgi:hypothetical protein
MTFLPLLVALLAAPASAQDHVAWDLLQRAMLAEAASGDYDGSLREYERLVRNLGVDHPVRAEALFRLGSARYILGDSPGAREALMEGIRTGSCGAPCHILLGRIQLEADSIRRLPVHWNFSDSQHGVFHPWEFDDKGAIRVQDGEEAANPALIWQTIVDVRKGDHLVIGFKQPTPAPKVVRFKMQADQHSASVRVRVVDDMGRAYGLPGPIRVGTERPAEIEVVLSEMKPADPQDPPMDTSSIYRLYIDDVSALNGTPPGPNALYLDDFVVE